MSHTLTETPLAFPDTITVPDDGDDGTAASVDDAFGPLAKRTRKLADMLGYDDTDPGHFNNEWKYGEGALTRYRTLELSDFVFQTDTAGAPKWAFNVVVTPRILVAQPLAAAPGAVANATIRVPNDGALASIDVWLNCSTARAGAQRWQLKLWRQDFDDASPYGFVTPVQIGTTKDDGGATGYTRVSFTAIAETVNNPTRIYFLTIEAPGATDPPTINDWLHAARVTFAELGPGR